jgi:hypothetical protein
MERHDVTFDDDVVAVALHWCTIPTASPRPPAAREPRAGKVELPPRPRRTASQCALTRAPRPAGRRDPRCPCRRSRTSPRLGCRQPSHRRSTPTYIGADATSSAPGCPGAPCPEHPCRESATGIFLGVDAQQLTSPLAGRFDGPPPAPRVTTRTEARPTWVGSAISSGRSRTPLRAKVAVVIGHPNGRQSGRLGLDRARISNPGSLTPRSLAGASWNRSGAIDRRRCDRSALSSGRSRSALVLRCRQWAPGFGAPGSWRGACRSAAW